MSKSIIVSSGKGGVGKTSVISNLGIALTALGKKVAVVDGSFSSADISLHLGIPFNVKTLHHVLSGHSQLYQAKFKHKSGVNIIPGDMSLDIINTTSDVDQSRFKAMIQELKHDHDYVLVDSSPGIDQSFIKTLECCDSVLVVANPELSSVVNTSKILKFAKDLGVATSGVILNRTNRHEHELTRKDITPLLHGVPIIENIKEDNLFAYSLKKSDPVVSQAPNSEVSLKFQAIAHYLEHGVYPHRNDRNPLTAFLYDRLGTSTNDSPQDATQNREEVANNALLDKELKSHLGNMVDSTSDERRDKESGNNSTERSTYKSHNIPITHDLFSTPHLDKEPMNTGDENNSDNNDNSANNNDSDGSYKDDNVDETSNEDEIEEKDRVVLDPGIIHMIESLKPKSAKNLKVTQRSQHKKKEKVATKNLKTVNRKKSNKKKSPKLKEKLNVKSQKKIRLQKIKVNPAKTKIIKKKIKKTSEKKKVREKRKIKKTRTLRFSLKDDRNDIFDGNGEPLQEIANEKIDEDQKKDLITGQKPGFFNFKKFIPENLIPKNDKKNILQQLKEAHSDDE